MIGNFKKALVHVDIRAFELVRRLLETTRHGDPTAASTALRRLKGPADRAAKKALRPVKTDSRKEWEADRDFADEQFSIYIRTRDTKPAGETRIGRCRTCGQVKEFKDLQCGHWQSRKHWGTRFHEFNCHAQGWECNSKMYGNGKMPEHEAYIRIAHPVPSGSAEWPERLKALVKTNPREKSGPELREIGKDYQRKTREILERESQAGRAQ